MRATKLIIRNIGIISNEEILINKPLLIFYGQIKEGKSTILRCIPWVCGGPFPDDIIKHGEKEASIEFHFVGGFISRSFYRNAKGETEARPIQFVRDGKPVQKPVREIERLLNPFITDQDYLIKMEDGPRKKYLAEQFAPNTTDLDLENTRLAGEAQNLRSEIKGYGEIDLTEYKQVDTADLSAKRKAIVDEAAEKRRALEASLETLNNKHESDISAWNTTCAAVDTHNATVLRGEESFTSQAAEITELETKLSAMKTKHSETKAWLTKNPKRTKAEKPAAPDTTKLKGDIHKLHTPDTAVIDQQIQDAGATNARAETYQKNLVRSQELSQKQLALKSKEDRQRAMRAEKIAKLKDASESSGIKGLEFDEEGNFVYDGTSAGMLSTSQLMKLSQEISARYPEGLSIALLDRGESLGKSIFDLIDRAKKDERTILATVVGDKPATVPENVGVFVVSEGKIS